MSALLDGEAAAKIVLFQGITSDVTLCSNSISLVGPSDERAWEFACGAHFPCVAFESLTDFLETMTTHVLYRTSFCCGKKEHFRTHGVWKFDSHVVFLVE